MGLGVEPGIRPPIGSHQPLFFREVLDELLDQKARPAPSRSDVSFLHGPTQVPKAGIETRVRVVEARKPCRHECHASSLTTGEGFATPHLGRLPPEPLVLPLPKTATLVQHSTMGSGFGVGGSLAGAAGRSTRNVEPFPTSLSTERVPL
jgi:hypothetical protein